MHMPGITVLQKSPMGRAPYISTKKGVVGTLLSVYALIHEEASTFVGSKHSLCSS